MNYFQSSDEIKEIMGGYFSRLPAMSSLVMGVIDGDDSLLKIELKNPSYVLSLNCSRKPIEVEIDSDDPGTIGISTEADLFHELLLGHYDFFKAMSNKKFVMHGPLSRLLKNSNLIYLSPFLYTLYLKYIGREDLLANGAAPFRNTSLRASDWLGKLFLRIMFMIGSLIGICLIKSSRRFDVFRLLEITGPFLMGLVALLRKLGASDLSLVMTLKALGLGMNRPSKHIKDEIESQLRIKKPKPEDRQTKNIARKVIVITFFIVLVGFFLFFSYGYT